MKNTILLLQKEHDRKRILELSMKNTIVSMSRSPLFYVVHAYGTKNKWIIKMVKDFYVMIV